MRGMKFLLAGLVIFAGASTAFAYVKYTPNGGSPVDPAPAGEYVGSVDIDAMGGQQHEKVWVITTESGTLHISDDDPSLSQTEKDALTAAANQGDNNNRVNIGANGAVDRVRTR